MVDSQNNIRPVRPTAMKAHILTVMIVNFIKVKLFLATEDGRAFLSKQRSKIKYGSDFSLHF